MQLTYPIFHSFRLLSILFIFSGCHPQLVVGQTIWEEPFNYPDGTQSSGNWTTSFSDCDDTPPHNVPDQSYWGVFNGRFRVNDIEGFSCDMGSGNNSNSLTTESIDISNEGCVNLSVTVSNGGGLECDFPAGPDYNTAGTFSGHDQLVVQYQLNGGAWQTFPNNGYFCGSASGTATANDLSGSTIRIRIRVGNQANSENYYFDNIRVTATTNDYTLPNLGPYCSDDGTQNLPSTVDGISGDWSGPGVSGNTFRPSSAGPGSHTLTFSPDNGQCAIDQTTTVNVSLGASLNDLADQEACEEFILPNITGANVPANAAYFTAPNGSGTRYQPGDAINSSDILYIYGGAGSCSDQESFRVTITPAPDLVAVGPQTGCGQYTFPPIQGSNLNNPRYFTQPNGTGQAYDPGDIYTTVRLPQKVDRTFKFRWSFA